MRRTLFLARHGETDWNAQNRWQGHTDIPLNEAGRAQALALAARLTGQPLAGVLASDLGRARETAEIAARTLGVPFFGVDPALRERGFGCFEGLTRSECEERHPEDWARYRADSRQRPSGAEPHEAVIERMAAALRRAAAAPGEHPLLVVSHGGALRAVLTHETGRAFAPMGNAAVFRVVFESARIVEVDELP